MAKNYTTQDEPQDQNHVVGHSDEHPKTETSPDVSHENETSPNESRDSEAEVGESQSVTLPMTETDDAQHEDKDNDPASAFATEPEQSNDESIGKLQDDDDSLN